MWTSCTFRSIGAVIYSDLERFKITIFMAKKYIQCPRCGQVKVSTRHHVFPKRHFKDKTIVRICRECHDHLENGIHRVENKMGGALDRTWYQLLWDSFIGQ